jgi:DNA invertase Pin-like site-specific DNA recombinase
MKKHVGVYVRVSTQKQDTRSQEPDLKRWIEAFAVGMPVIWYRDKATGKTMDRPGWKRLEADMHAGKISRIVVWRVDRLGRTAAGLTALFEDLIRRGIAFESLRDRLDLSTPGGRLTAHVLASVAAFENEVRSERIRAGQAVARANGKRWGGSVRGRRIHVSDEQVAVILRMHLEGASKSAMSRATNLTRPTVYRLLREIASQQPATPRPARSNH